MKSLKKSFCCLLAFCLMVGMLGITALADGGQNEAESTITVTVTGDSIAAAYALPGYLNFWPVKDGEKIEDSYTAILEDDLKAYFDVVDMRRDAHIAWRTTEFLNALSAAEVSVGAYDPCYDDPYDPNGKDGYLMKNWCTTDFFRTAFGVNKNGMGFKDVGAKIAGDIAAADLVTVNFGANDIYDYGLCAVLGKWVTPLLSADLGSIDGLNELMRTFLELLLESNEGQRHTILSDFINALELGLARYINNIPLVINAIQSINKDAKIVIIGVKPPIMNPLHIGDLTIDLAAYLDPLIVRANAVNSYNCAKFGCLYVDVAGTDNYGFGEVELSSDITQFFFDFLKAVHPTEDGHAYMAQCIENAVFPMFAAPADVKVETGTSFLTKPHLSWNAVPGAEGYVVYRSLLKNIGYHPVKTVKGVTATDFTALAGLSYFYRVSTMLNPSGTLQSKLSEPVFVSKVSSILDYLKPIFSFKIVK